MESDGDLGAPQRFAPVKLEPNWLKLYGTGPIRRD